MAHRIVSMKVSAAGARTVGTVALILGCLVAACSDGGTGPADSQFDLRPATGNGQTSFAGWELPWTIRTELVRADGSPAFEEGIPVEWSVGSGGGSVVSVTGVTNSGGRASARWTLGSTLGEQTLVASIPGGARATFTARAVDASGPIVFSGQPPWDPDISQVFTVQPDGSELVQLARSETPTFLPRWSPDGSQIVAYRRDEGLVLLDERGHLARVLVSGSTQGHAWSPDGASVVFAARRPDASCDGGSDTGNIYILEIETGSETQLTSGCDNRHQQPDWSSDGQWITFATRNPTESDIFAIRPDGSGEYSVVSTSGSPYEGVFEAPRWEPGRNVFAVTLWGGGDDPNSILTLDLRGTMLDDVVALDASQVPIVETWSPDASSLVFTQRGEGEGWTLMRLILDSGESHPLAGFHADTYAIGGRLLFTSGADWR